MIKKFIFQIIFILILVIFLLTLINNYELEIFTTSFLTLLKNNIDLIDTNKRQFNNSNKTTKIISKRILFEKKISSIKINISKDKIKYFYKNDRNLNGYDNKNNNLENNNDNKNNNEIGNKNYTDIYNKNNNDIGNKNNNDIINKNNNYMDNRDNNDFGIKNNNNLDHNNDVDNKDNMEYKPPNNHHPPEIERNFNNISSIELGECERILKNKYNLDENITLIINKIKNTDKMDKRPPMTYEVYEPINNTKLDLNFCRNQRFRIGIPVKIDEKHLFKYDRYSEYYNDICYSYTSDNGADIILRDRRREFLRKNMSLCESNCDYRGYDQNLKQAKCECDIEGENNENDSDSEEIINEEKFFNSFINITSITNIEVVKCYKKIFTKDGLIKNYGNYIIVFIILIYIISLIYFIFQGYNSFIYKIRYIVKIKNKKKKTDNKIQKINFPPKKIKSKNIKNFSLMNLSKNTNDNSNKSIKFKNNENELNLQRKPMKQKNGILIFKNTDTKANKIKKKK